MALIECPDCGKLVSDAAAACPNCARPLSDKPVLIEKTSRSLKTWLLLWFILGVGSFFCIALAPEMVGLFTLAVLACAALFVITLIAMWYRHG